MKQDLYNSIKEYLRRIIEGTEWEGHVYTVGGCVRDEIIGDEVKDIDICVTLQNGGIRFAEWLQDSGLAVKTTTVYSEFGTAKLHLVEFPDIEMEFVQTRKEKYLDSSSRNPETAFGTMEDDCWRRDFTINALYCDITKGEIIDLTGMGLQDIRNHVIRTTNNPDAVFNEDPLRILRCIRFASRYSWEIEPVTYEGMVCNVSRLEIITKERIREELDKMLTCEFPVMAMELLRKTRAMHFVIPELEETYEMEQNEYHFGTVWEHTLMVLEKLKSNKLELRMAALLHDIGKTRVRSVLGGKTHFLKHELVGSEMVNEALRPLKYSNDFIRNVVFLVGNHMRCKKWGAECENMKDKKLRLLQFECGTEERFRNLLMLIDADNNAHADDKCMPNQVEIISQHTKAMIDEGVAMFGYRLPINGQEVMQVKGIKAGPKVRECLDYLLKIAFVDPLMEKNEMIKLLKSYRIRKA